MEATRLAPAGRACSKFVWQSRFQKNWAVRVLVIRAARPFVMITHRRRLLRISGARGVRWYLIDLISIIGRRSAGLRFGPASWKCAPAGAVIGRLQFFAGYGWLSEPRGLATLLPRLGVTPRGRNAADGGTAVQRIGALLAPRREVPVQPAGGGIR
jgi:hypothetical protein